MEYIYNIIKLYRVTEIALRIAFERSWGSGVD